MNNMVISSNEQATRIHGMYNRNVGQMNAAMTRIATAQKINSAKDNASVWAISQKMRERMRANDQANQNVQNDSALLKTAQGGLDNTLSILNTLKERAVNAANDSNISGDREKIAEEVRQLVTQIDENANRVKFNGRVLLNGAGETADATTTGVSGASTAKAVTADGNYGNMAVYSLTGLKTSDGTALAGTEKLVDLVDEKGNAVFREGDKITFSWTENGEAKQTSLLVDDSTALSAFTGASGLSFASVTAPVYAKLAGESLTAVDEQGTNLASNERGIFFQGIANTNVSNVAIGVTDAAGNVKKETQALLELNPIQQSYGDPNKGSNLVYSIAATNFSLVYTDATNTSIVTTNDNSTEFYKFSTLISTSPTGAGDSKDAAGAIYTLTINENEVTFTGNKSIDQINQLLKDRGIDVRLDLAKAGEQIQYDDEDVTKGTYGASALYTTASAGLKIIAGSDQEITTLKLAGPSSGKFAATTLDISQGTNSIIKAELLRDDTTATTSSKTDASSAMLPRGQELQFFVGGEQNFGVNFAIGKATAQNLLGMGIEDFAAKFGDKDGANEAIGIIDNAISKTLVEQTRLGAMEARLGYTSDNLVTMNENLESGVAAYTGSDMAKEMTEYMKYSVVSQAAQYMLANAGQNAYNVLQLLQP